MIKRSELNSRERVIKAMRLEKPDRVPLMCQFSIGFMMNQLKPDPVEFWYDEETFSRGLIELRDMFHFDGILVSLHGHSDNWKHDLMKKEIVEEGVVKLYYNDRTEIHSWSDLPVVEFVKPRILPSIESINIDSDIPDNLDYIPVSGNLYFPLCQDRLYSIFDRINNYTGGVYSIHGEITSPFDYFLDYLGYENGLMALITEPDKSGKILQKFTEGVKKIAQGMCDAPIDAIKISSPFAGRGFISTQFYEQFVLPFESQIISAIRSKGKEVYIHTCGHIGDRLELMASSGASGLECLDPKPVGDVDLEDAFKRIGDNMFIKGNIDSVNTLLFGSQEKIIKDVSNIIDIGKRQGKGFILSTACSIAPRVSRDNLLLLSDLIENYGKY